MAWKLLRYKLLIFLTHVVAQHLKEHQHFGKYIYILSVRELDEEFNAALISLY